MEDSRREYLENGKVKLHSNIKKFFSTECLLELETLLINNSIDNNSKIVICDSILRKYKIPFSKLGGGTNRYGIMIDGYVYKIAMDKDGQTDNKREFIYTKAVYPYVIKVYECMQTGLIMVCEYLTVFTLDDFYENQKEMKEILSEISKVYFIGDIGIDSKNYYNWGYRLDGSIAILDFAYIYTQSFKTIRCTCGSLELLSYDDKYNLLICPTCGKKHTFWQLRKNITREAEQQEIGDILEKGYVISHVDEVVDFNPKFTTLPKDMRRKAKREKDEKARENEKRLRKMNSQKWNLEAEELEEHRDLTNRLIDEFLNGN